MQFPLLFGWRFSAVLNKAPYASCMNPHLGFYRPGRGGFMLHFPPSWPIWNIELDPKKRKLARQFARRGPVNPDCVRLFAFSFPPRPDHWNSWVALVRYRYQDRIETYFNLAGRTWKWTANIERQPTSS